MADDSFRRDLETLKRMPLETIAARWGYVRDTKASTRMNPVLRGPGLPRIVLKLQDNGHWTYFNTQDPDDNGTAVDFMKNRGLSFAAMRATTRATFLDTWRRAREHPAPPWLIRRGILRATLDTWKPLVRCDDGGHVLFAHRNARRMITGFEIAPPDGPRRFATGGRRALFALASPTPAAITALVITEGAVNALSLAQIDGCPTDHAFLSTAGAPGKAQCAQISRAARVLPALRSIILAQDGDAAGDRQAETLRSRVEHPSHVRMQRRRPPDNTDWNDILRNRDRTTTD